MNTASLFEIQPRRDYTLLRFFGFVDAGTVEQIRPALTKQLPENTRNIIIDLQRLDFLDSNGVGLFVSLLKRVHKQGGKLYLCGTDGQPAAVLQMVGFNASLVNYCATAQEAMAQFEAEARKEGLKFY